MPMFQRNDRIGEYTVDFRFMGGSYYESYFVTGDNGESGFIKLIPLDWLDDPQLSLCRRFLPLDELEISRFDRDGSLIEAKIASSLSDKSLCRFLGSGTLEKNGHRLLYIASEFAPGSNLKCLISEENRPDAKGLAQLMRALLQALDSLHRGVRPVIHNAVTPEHVWIQDGDFGRLKLTGFSHARFSDLAPDPMAWHGQDWCYVAPERVDGVATVRSDIFSAGALMYWLVFGSMPWGADIDWKSLWAKVLAVPLAERQDHIVRLLRERLSLLTERRRTPLPIPDKKLIDINERQLLAMTRALSPDPDKRFASAQEFLDALGVETGADDSTDARADETDSAARLDDLSDCNSADDTDDDDSWADLFDWTGDDDSMDDLADDISDAVSQNSVSDPRADETNRAVQEKKTESGSRKGNGFADVAGMEDIKAVMRNKIINVLKDPELAEKYRIHIPNGMLLYGPPGCGKSFIAEKFAEEAGWNYKLVKSSDLASTYIHGSQEKIGALFDEARKNAPMILNFDEFDALVPDRSRLDSSHLSSEVNEFLSQMNNCGKDRVFVIASSNRPDLIDPAVRRKGRLDQMIYIPVPDLAAREGMFSVQMEGRPQEESIDFHRLASLTENYVAADIAYIVNEAAERAFEKRVSITERMLEDVISRTVPSVGPDDISCYEGIREKLDTTVKRGVSRHIGFIQG